MNFRPDENLLLAYLYGELEGEEKEKLEQYFQDNPEAQAELEKLRGIQKMLSTVKDKEVIAPPIILGESRQRFLTTPYIRSVISVAASFLLILLAAKMLDMRVSFSDSELKIAFGEPKKSEVTPSVSKSNSPDLTTEEVQHMINASLSRNNEDMKASWIETQQLLDKSIQRNLAYNSTKVDQLVRTAASASQDQVREYVAAMQTQNLQLVRDYFQLTSTEQKQYIEDLLVDFAKYLQQQRNDDLMLMQARLNNLEENTDLFKLETEQILSSIITNTNLKEPTIKN